MQPSHPLMISFDPLERVKYWETMRWDYRRLNTNWEENLTKHVGSVHAYIKKSKNRKHNAEEGVDKQKKDSIDNEKQDPFQFVSVWFWSSRCCFHPYIFSFILNSGKQIWEMERATLYGRSPAAPGLATPLLPWKRHFADTCRVQFGNKACMHNYHHIVFAVSDRCNTTNLSTNIKTNFALLFVLALLGNLVSRSQS